MTLYAYSEKIIFERENDMKKRKEKLKNMLAEKEKEIVNLTMRCLEKDHLLMQNKLQENHEIEKLKKQLAEMSSATADVAYKAIMAVLNAQAAKTSGALTEGVLTEVERNDPAPSLRPATCANCLHWGSALDKEKLEKAKNDYAADVVCDFFGKDGFTPDDYCSFFEPRDKEI